MGRNDGTVQFCTKCGEGLVVYNEVMNWDTSRSRVTLRCPNKKRSDASFISIFLGPDNHTDKFVEYTDTVLNYDPITGERIKHVNTK